MYIQTHLSADHIELIKIFMQANELYHVDILVKKRSIDGLDYLYLDIITLDEQDAEKLTFMGIRHSGVLNMLDDYLMKCNVSPFELEAKPMVDKVTSNKTVSV